MHRRNPVPCRSLPDVLHMFHEPSRVGQFSIMQPLPRFLPFPSTHLAACETTKKDQECNNSRSRHGNSVYSLRGLECYGDHLQTIHPTPCHAELACRRKRTALPAAEVTSRCDLQGPGSAGRTGLFPPAEPFGKNKSTLSRDSRRALTADHLSRAHLAGMRSPQRDLDRVGKGQLDPAVESRCKCKVLEEHYESSRQNEVGLDHRLSLCDGVWEEAGP